MDTGPNTTQTLGGKAFLDEGQAGRAVTNLNRANPGTDPAAMDGPSIEERADEIITQAQGRLQRIGSQIMDFVHEHNIDRLPERAKNIATSTRGKAIIGTSTAVVTGGIVARRIQHARQTAEQQSFMRRAVNRIPSRIPTFIRRKAA
jgi:hypothetical protein